MFFNEYISTVLMTSGFEYLIANYINIREEFYSWQSTT